MTAWDEKKQDVESDWWKEVNGWPWELVGKYEVVKAGECPQCGHQMSASRKLTALGDMSTFAPTASGVRIACNCTRAHPGRDAGVLGCGFYGFFDLPSTAPAVSQDKEGG